MNSKASNRLVHETSPYLLQHAYNPVDWYPWGQEALDCARRLNNPIFLSIGYAACHWCHVMEHESFENEEVARILNEHFVCIKVDREERPDLDDIYMQATVLYSRGHGGWPMSVFLTPDMRPFFAGTYFPPDDAYGRPGFRSLLLRIAEAWQQHPGDLARDAEQVTGLIQKMQAPATGDIMPREKLSAVIGQIAEAYDMQWGGLASGSNKFPPSMSMELLLREYRKTGERRLLAAVEITLEKMAFGGIYDHLGGGICRYSTDPQWLVPHFEKMLYDQALVSSIYLDGYQVTGRKLYADTARGIFDYVLRDLRSEQGAFYSSEDADSEGLEGKFYIWTLEEVRQLLGEDDARLFASCYDVTEWGNWRHPGDDHVPHGPKNILQVPRLLELVAKLNGTEIEALEKKLAYCRQKLFEVRSRRVRPGLDDKILADWNGLMIASLAKGGLILDDARYLQAAEAGARFVLEQMMQNDRLFHTYGKGQPRLMAYISDYAFMIDALLWLFEATGRASWLKPAEGLLETSIRYYWDEVEGGFFFTASDHEELIHRSKSAVDNAIPSGNSVMLENILRLAALLTRDDLREKAAQLIRAFGAAFEQSPFGHDRLACGVEAWHDAFPEIVIVGRREDPRTSELVRAVYSKYLPNKVVVPYDPSSGDAAWLATQFPLLAQRTTVAGKPAAYVCRDYTCLPPVTDAGSLATQLAE